MTYLQVGGGLVLLFLGGELVVWGSVSLARRLGVSALIIGLTVVGFGTSSPELVVSVGAALKGRPDIAVGNVVGSNIANILLILGVAGLVFPIACTPRSFYRDGLTLLATTGLFVALGLVGVFERVTGAVMLVLLSGYLAYSYRDERVRGPSDAAAERHVREAEEIRTLPGGTLVSAAAAAAGLVALVLGAGHFVEGGVEVARAIGVSEAVIGLTLIALGTSLPELAAAIVAALHRHPDVTLGNVLGSNMFNLLGVMGAAALARPVTVAEKFARWDLWVMLLMTILLLLFLVRGWRISRRDAAVLMAAYAVYVALQFTGPLGSSAAAGGALGGP